MSSVVLRKTARPEVRRELALVQPLPGETQVDSASIDQIVTTINAVHRLQSLETVRLIGEAVLAHFFAGDPNNFRTRANGHVSFRALAKRDDLQCGYLFIYNSVAVVDQMRQLPTDLAEALPLAHQKLLLPVKDAALKTQLARLAVTDNLPKRAFEAKVQEARRAAEPESNAGRPPLPGFVKAVTVLRKAVELAQADAYTPGSGQFSHFTQAEAQAALAELEAQVAALGRVVERVRAGVLGE